MEKTSLTSQKILAWIKKNKKECLILFGIVLLAAILRLFRISEYMTFLGDEGRDVIIVRRLLLYADPILVGPGTSIGNMYLGPLYYYFMAPGLFLANYSPVGPAIEVALLGILTVILVYYMARDWFGKNAAVISSLLYSIAPVIIIYSRSSWNPNIMPFFSILCIYSIWKVWIEDTYKWLLVAGVSFAFVLQSHYLGLLLVPTMGLFWGLKLLSLIRQQKSKQKSKSLKSFFANSFGGLLIFLFLMSPLVIFDARHGWRNFDAIKKFFTERETTVAVKPWNSFSKLYPLFEKINTRVVASYNPLLGKWVSIALLSIILFVTGASKKLKMTTRNQKAFLVLTVWTLVALLGLASYKQEVYDHYYGFLFGAPFLIIGGFGQLLIDNSRIRGKSIVILGVFIVVAINLLNSPIKYSPNRQLQRTEEVSEKIIELSEGKKFNLAVIAERNYDAAYRYFLETHKAQVLDIDPQRTSETITDQLFVVCEMVKEKCDPTHNPKAEVANFGWSKISGEWEVSGTIIFKLTHSQ